MGASLPKLLGEMTMYAQTLSVNDLLFRLANTERYHGSRNDELRGPYWLMVAGELWTVATDARSMLWCRGFEQTPEEYARQAIHRADGRIAENLMLYFGPPAGDARHEVSLCDLKQFLGVPEWEVQCPSCKGLSKGNESLYCSYCEGDGTVSPEIRLGRLHGVTIDCNRLARIVLPMADYDVLVFACQVPAPPIHWRSKQKDNRMNVVYVVHAGFRAVLVGIDPESDKKEAAESPQFP